MTRQKRDLPEHLKRAIQSLLISQMGSGTLDPLEIELFDWYERETEVILNEMLSTELLYIREQSSVHCDDMGSGIIAVEYFAKRIRYSHVIYLTSLLETSLERACSALINTVGHEIKPFGPNELKGDQWQKTIRFLNRYGNFEFPGDLWEELRSLIAVRNCLVHENGNTINLSLDKLRAMRNYPGISIESSELVIEVAYIHYASAAVKAFLRELEQRVKKVLEKVRQP